MDRIITRKYEADASGELAGRPAGLSLDNGYDVTYSYDAKGRFDSVRNGDDTFSYDYLANSNLISTRSTTNSQNSFDALTTFSYESNRNLIDYIENKTNATVISKYDYTNDVLGRRDDVAKSGSAFSQTDIISYGYNDRSEVISALADNDTAYDYGFSFDNIGNRLTSSQEAVGMTYTPNSMNQFDAVNGVSQSYDLDGNLVDDGGKLFTWNAENRLIEIESSTAKVEFTYDYMGRRISKQVSTRPDVSSSFILQTSPLFVYDGYLQIQELDALNSDSVEKQYVWNNGQLLSMTDDNGTYYYTHDANKNVSELIDTNGAVVAHYEYSPFGQVTKSTGTMASENKFRFSNEYVDDETGLVYYNYRYYNPAQGKWLSRDPINS